MIKISEFEKIHGHKFCLTMLDGKKRYFTRRDMGDGNGKIFEMRGGPHGEVFMYQKLDEDLTVEAVERIFKEYIEGIEGEA